jgi:hypothetical protein
VSSPIRGIAAAGALCLTAASLASCGTAGQGLIPSASAGPLKGDFEEVAQAAQSGAGNCTATESAIAKTQHDFGALPATIDSGLRDRLQAGITNLRKIALVACAQPHTQTNATTAATATSQSASTSPSVTETSTTETSATTTTSTPPGAGGTPAPGEGGEEGPGGDHGRGKGNGKEKGNGNGHGEGRGPGRSGGASVGE